MRFTIFTQIPSTGTHLPLTQPWCEFLGQVGCHLLATRLVSQLRSDVTPNSATLSSYIGLEPGFTPLVGIWKPYKNT